MDAKSIPFEITGLCPRAAAPPVPPRLCLVVACLLAAFLAPTVAHSQNIWKGGVIFHQGNWSTPVNWSLDMVPDGTTDVSIPIGISTDNVNVDFGSHTLSVGAQLNINSGVELQFDDGSMDIGSSGIVNNSGLVSGESMDIFNFGTLNNNGQMDLNSASFLLNNNVVNNAGSLTITGATNGGLRNQGGILNNSGTLINQSTLENEVVFDGLHLNHGEINNTGLLVNGSSTTIGNLTNDALTFISNSGFLGNSFGSNFTNSGTVQNQSGGRLDNEGHLENDAIMTNAVGAIVQNSGFLSNFGTFTNNGANDPTFIAGLENLGSGAIENDGSFTNNGTMNNRGAFFNGILIQNGAVATFFTNTGALANTGAITTDSSFTNSGTLINSGTITNLTTSVPLFGTVVGTIQNSGLFDNQFGGVVMNRGSITNSGTITNEGVFENGDVNVSGATFNTTAGSTFSNSGTLTNFANNTVLNAGTMTTGVFLENNGNFSNSGSLTNAQFGFVENAGAINNSGSFTNNSTTNFFGPPVPQVGFLNNTSGFLSNSGSLVNNGSMDNQGIVSNTLREGTSLGSFANTGTLSNSGTIANSSVLTNSGTLSNTGTVENFINHFADIDLTVPGRIENAGLFDNQRGGAVTNFGSFTNTGMLNNEDGARFSNTGTLNNETGGIINDIGAFNNSGGMLNNAGTLNVTPPTFGFLVNINGTINDSGVINAINTASSLTTISGGAIHVLGGGQFNNFSGGVSVDTFDVAGGLRNDGAVIMASSNALLITPTGTLSGTGSVTGNVMMQGVLSPGDSPGILHITGNYAQTSTAVFIFETLGTGAGQSDELIVNGNISLNGAFDVDLLSGFAPASGDSWVVLDYTGTRTGTFASELFPVLSSGLGWLVLYDDVNTDVVLDICALGSTNCVAGTETGGGGGGGGGTGGSPTPEPGTLMLFG
ncbi:MAG TPA: hypothetical protein VFO39_08790, partial [Candidatus Sulfotelmatobacter sp.]|nr:hypothetical protein [Candidatus Sulfotelmatobacter sp.]